MFSLVLCVKQTTADVMPSTDWSSGVCSSDLCMKRFATVAALGVGLARAGCGKSDEAGKADGTATTDAGATAGPATGPIKREAGNWKTEVKLVKFDMPGASAAMKDQMAKQFRSEEHTSELQSLMRTSYAVLCLKKKKNNNNITNNITTHITSEV